MQDYVTAQRAEGQLLGDGSFTLNPAEALRKLAAFQLPQPSYWILKLLQAAVAQRHTHPIDFAFAGRQVTASFKLSENWTARSIYRALLNPEMSSTEDALSHLVQALRVLTAQPGSEYELELPESGGILRWSRQEFSVDRNPTKCSLTLKAKHSGPPHDSRPDPAADLRYLLRTRGALSPNQLTVNKKPVSLVINLVDQSAPIGADYETYLLNIHTLDRPWPSFPIPGSVAKEVETLLHPPGQTKPKPPKDPNCALLSFLWCRPKSGTSVRLAWVRDGVIVRERNVSFPGTGVTLQVYLSAEGHRSDLTGFQVVESEALEEQTRWALEQSLAELQRQAQTFAIQRAQLKSLGRWERFCLSMQDQTDRSGKPTSAEKSQALAKVLSGLFPPVGLLLINDQLRIRKYRRQSEVALKTLTELWPRIVPEFI